MPFDFSVAGRTMPAGRYQVTPASIASPAFLIRGQKDAPAVLALFPTPEYDYAAQAPPRMIFRCADAENSNGCELSGVWTSNTNGAPRPEKRKAAKNEPVVLAAE